MESWEVKLIEIIEQFSFITVQIEHTKLERAYPLVQADYWLKLYYNKGFQYFDRYVLPELMHKTAAQAIRSKYDT